MKQIFKGVVPMFQKDEPTETPYTVAAKSVTAQLDAVIRKAISNHLGREIWEDAEVLPRLSRCVYPDSEVETITMDGEPILSVAFPPPNIEQRDVSAFFSVTVLYKILNEKEPKT